METLDLKTNKNYKKAENEQKVDRNGAFCHDNIIGNGSTHRN
jgi:predicted ester cyclase